MEITKLFGNTNEQEEGKWVRHESGAEFKVRYSESKGSRRFVTNQISKARQKSRKAFVSGEKMAEITLDLLVDKVVVDWRGIEKDGEPYPYSKDNCRFILEESAILRDFISVEAQDPENFGIEVEADEDDEEKKAEGTGGAGSKSNRPGVEPAAN